MATNDDDSDSVTPLPDDAAHKATVVSSARTDATPGDLINSSNAAKIAGIVVAVAYVFSSGPIGGPVVALIAVMALFAPDIFPDTTFGDLTKDIQDIMYPAIEASQLSAAVNLANAALRANNLKFDQIAIDFKTWQDTPDSAEGKHAKLALESAFFNLRGNFIADMTRDFTRADFAGSLVPQYVSSASRYLATLIAYYKHAAELELHLHFPSPSKTIQEIVLAQFRTDLASITDTAMKSYRDGLKKIISGSTNYPRSWDDYTNYRNLITVTGLDLLAHLQCIDPILYPHGYHATNLNRKLVSILGTDLRAGALRRRGNILEIEAEFYKLTPVRSLTNLRLEGANFRQGTAIYHGLSYAECTQQSLDGFVDIKVFPITGTPIPDGAVVKSTYKIPFQNNGFAIRGRHWKATTAYTRQTITQIIFYRHASYNISQMVPVYCDFNVGHQPDLQADFIQAVPERVLVDAPTSASDFTERLANFEIVVDANDYQHSYLLSWHHHTALLPMQPAGNHATQLKKAPVEQFHPVKASRGIVTSTRNHIIAGSGFTGGDMLEMWSRAYVTFILRRTSENWFAGWYKVRLWYVPHSGLEGSAFVSFRVEDAYHVPSVINLEIFGKTPPPNLKELKYEDLQCSEFSGNVLIVATMQRVSFTLTNLSWSLPIIIDRIELIFDGPASDPILDESSDHAFPN